MHEDPREAMFLSRINQEDSLRKSNLLLNEILGKKTNLNSLAVKNGSPEKPSSVNSSKIIKSQGTVQKPSPWQQANPRFEELSPVKANSQMTNIAAPQAQNNSNFVSSNNGKTDNSSSQQQFTAGAKKKAENMKTFDDSESMYNGSRPMGPFLNESDQKKFTNEYSDKQTFKQMTIVSKAAHKQGDYGDNTTVKSPPQRSLTNANDLVSRNISRNMNNDKLKKVSSSNSRGLMGPMVNILSPIVVPVSSKTRHDRSQDNSPLGIRQNSLSDNESQQYSMIDEKKVPSPTGKQPIKGREYAINVTGTQKTTVKGIPSIQIYSSQRHIDGSMMVQEENGGSNNRLDASQLLGGDLKKPQDASASIPQLTGPKSILKKSTREIEDSNRNKSVFEMALEVHSNRSRKSKLFSSRNCQVKSVIFAPENNIHIVESYKEYNRFDYLDRKDEENCCKKCTLI